MKFSIEDITIEDLYGEQKYIAEAVGLDTYLQLVDAVGGANIYIAKADKIEAIIRNNQIIKAFNGYNYRELAEKYRLTERMIRQIIDEKRKTCVNQLSLLDYAK